MKPDAVEIANRLHQQKGHAKCAGCDCWMFSNDKCFECCDDPPTNAEEREAINFANDVEVAMMQADPHRFDFQKTEVIDNTEPLVTQTLAQNVQRTPADFAKVNGISIEEARRLLKEREEANLMNLADKHNID